MVLLSLK